MNHTEIKPDWHRLDTEHGTFFGHTKELVEAKARVAARHAARATADHFPHVSLAAIQIAAKQYRLENGTDCPYMAHGVVIVNQSGNACGWVNEPRNPEHWEPGCYAVDTNATVWVACGGNNYDGATEWVQTTTDFAHLPEGMRDTARAEQAAALKFTENRHAR